MNRSARSLLSVCVLAPVVAALAVAAAPANATPGPSTTLLYETAAKAAPVTRTLPDPVTEVAGQTAEVATGAVDEVLYAAPVASDLRSTTARCTLNPGKTVNSKTGAGLPETPLPSVGQTSLGGLPQGDCLGTTSRTAGRSDAVPGLSAAGDLPGTLVEDVRKVGTAVHNSRLGGLPGAQTALPSARRAETPLSMAVPGGDLPNVPATLGSARPAGLPVGSTLFPSTGRYAQPVPSDDLVGQANETVNQVGSDLDGTEDGVGNVAEVLKTRDRVRNPADGPVSVLDTPGIGLPDVPVPGLG